MVRRRARETPASCRRMNRQQRSPPRPSSDACRNSTQQTRSRKLNQPNVAPAAPRAANRNRQPQTADRQPQTVNHEPPAPRASRLAPRVHDTMSRTGGWFMVRGLSLFVALGGAALLAQPLDRLGAVPSFVEGQGRGGFQAPQGPQPTRAVPAPHFEYAGPAGVVAGAVVADAFSASGEHPTPAPSPTMRATMIACPERSNRQSNPCNVWTANGSAFRDRRRSRIE